MVKNFYCRSKREGREGRTLLTINMVKIENIVSLVLLQIFSLPLFFLLFNFRVYEVTSFFCLLLLDKLCLCLESDMERRKE